MGHNYLSWFLHLGRRTTSFDTKYTILNSFHFLSYEKYRDHLSLIFRIYSREMDLVPEGLLGPKYSFADELKTPSEMGIRKDGSFDGIMRAVGGINYYVDAIGFGEATMLAKDLGMHQNPLGIRYFMKTGSSCDNGADMYEYISTVPNGLPGRVGDEIQKTLGVKFRGLAPGIVEDAASALNPLPILSAAIHSGYGKCKKVTLPVGDMNGRIKSDFDQSKSGVWIPDPVKMINGMPHQTRWVLDQYVTMEDYDNTPKTVEPGTLPATEGFCNSPSPSSTEKVAAGVLFAALVIGILTYVKKR